MQPAPYILQIIDVSISPIKNTNKKKKVKGKSKRSPLDQIKINIQLSRVVAQEAGAPWF